MSEMKRETATCLVGVSEILETQSDQVMWQTELFRFNRFLNHFLKHRDSGWSNFECWMGEEQRWEFKSRGDSSRAEARVQDYQPTEVKLTSKVDWEFCPWRNGSVSLSNGQIMLDKKWLTSNASIIWTILWSIFSAKTVVNEVALIRKATWPTTHRPSSLIYLNVCNGWLSMRALL